jgi:hypothetical protein
MNKYLKRSMAVAVLAIVACAGIALLNPEPAQAQAESYIQVTNVFGMVTVTSTNAAAITPVPTGYIALQKRFRVASGTLTVANVLGTTNVTIGGGAATNTFITGTGSTTFAAGDGWVTESTAPILNVGTITGFHLGTYGGTAASGLVTGTVTTATVWYWLQLRTQ